MDGQREYYASWWCRSANHKWIKTGGREAGEGGLLNIYRIIEDGEHILIKARTPKEAIDVCLKSYLEGENIAEIHKGPETQYYYDEILQSCELIGKLRN